jgi:excinuclease ABC subunit A
MHFMGNVEILCEKCEGKRFDNETLEVTYKGKNIFDVLELYVSEALEFFRDQPGILRFLDTMNNLGLGYLKLGQRSTTLSGGEAQRVKLATELAFPHSAHTVYILDEPTTGLHQADVRVLLSALDTLIQQGNTVILIEHHLGVIAAADHVIDLGPGSGKDGGSVVAYGTPEEIAGCTDSYTGHQVLTWLFAIRRSPLIVKFYPHPHNQHQASLPVRQAGSIQNPEPRTQNPASTSPASLPTIFRT